jgi:ribosomal protein L37AE/L43A
MADCEDKPVPTTCPSCNEAGPRRHNTYVWWCPNCGRTGERKT